MWFLQRQKISSTDETLQHIILLDDFTKEYHFGRSINSQYSCPNVFVSREHCKISFNNACQPRIYDKNTLNGTFINGQRISSNENQILKKGDVIGLGVDSSLSNYIEGAFVYKLDIDESIQNQKQENETRRCSKRTKGPEENKDGCTLPKIPKLPDDAYNPINDDDLNNQLIENKKQNILNIVKSEPEFQIKIKEEPLNNSQMNYIEDVIIIDDDDDKNDSGTSDKLNYSTNEEDVIVISDEEGEDNFPNSQIFDCNIFPKEEIEIKDEYGFDQDNSLDDDNDSIICEDDYDNNLNRWIEVLSQEKKSVDIPIIKIEHNVDYDSISKTIDDEDLNLVLNKKKIVEDDNLITITKDENLIKTTEDENLIKTTEDENLIKITEDENLIKITEDENLIKITEDENLIKITVDETLKKIVEDENLTNKQLTPSSASISETLTNEKNKNGEVKNLFKKQIEGIKLISPLPLVSRKIESKNKKEIKSKKSANESAIKPKTSKKSTPKIFKNAQSSSECIDKGTKLEIRNQRKQKLKSLALQNLETKKNAEPKIHTSEIKIKNTKKSRGDILTEEFLSKPSTSSHNDVDIKSSTESTAINKIKIPKKTRKSNEIKSKKLEKLTKSKPTLKALKKGSSLDLGEIKNDCSESKLNAINEAIIPLVPDILSMPPIRKKKFSENLNFLDGEKRISLMIDTNIGLTNGTTKEKRVRFNEAIIKEYVIDEGCYLTATKNAKQVEKNAPLIKKNQKDIHTKASSLSLDVVADIMGWKVTWLNEAKNNALPPPVVDLKSLRNVITKYSNFMEYKNIFIPLLYLEIWSNIHNDFLNKHFPNAYIKIESFELNAVKLSQGKHLFNINCWMALSEKDKINTMHPKVGEIVILEIKHSLDPDSQTNKKAAYTNMFGYVANINIIKKNKDNIGIYNNLIKDQQKNYDFDLRFQVITKYRNMNITVGGFMRLRVISQLRGHIKTMKALYYIENSPLLKCIIYPRIHDFTLEEPTLKFYSQREINEMQMKCVLKVAHNCLKTKRPFISLIQGPPGSGKTTMIIQMILQLLHEQRRNPNYKVKILLCAPSNAAIDVIVSRLLLLKNMDYKDKPESELYNFNIVRVGVQNAIHPSVQPVSVKNLATESLKNQSSTTHLNLEINILGAKLQSLLLSNIDKAQINFLQTQITQFKNQVTLFSKESKYHNSSENYERQHEILQKADIVASTLSSCSTSLMENCFLHKRDTPSFTCCIIDEATQAIEPETLIPLVFGIDKLILIGDQEQLPATVLSQYAKKFNFNQSLFSRLQELFSTECTKSPVMLLNEQYRMHPEILKFPNQFFYHNQLHTPQTIINSRDSFLHPYRIFDLDFIQKDNSDFSNPDEAKFVADLSYSLFMKTKEKEKNYKIGIITPYQRQKITIINSLNKSIIKQIWVNTIDSFQGQEKDIVIFSIGRSQGIGFLADHQRLNVALTRAKYSLIICGNFASLKNHHLWKNLLEDSIKRNCYFSLTGNYHEDVIGKIIK